MFRGTLHDTFFLTVLDTFSYTFTVRRLLLRCPVLSASPSTAHSARRVMFWPPGRTIPLTGCEPMSLSPKSAASTPRSTNLREKDSLDMNLDDLATTLDASAMIDTTDVVLTSPMFFSGARSTCYPIQCFWFSDTFKRGESHAGHRSVLKHWETGARR